MKTPVRFLHVFIPGIDRYIITDNSSYLIRLPNLMRLKVYLKGDLGYVLDKYVLPKLYDILEFDYRLYEWFVIQTIVDCDIKNLGR